MDVDAATLIAILLCSQIHRQTDGGSCVNCQSKASQIFVPVLTAAGLLVAPVKAAS
jgi:hypothetical protein